MDRRRYIQHRRTVDVLPASWKQLVNSSTLGEVKMTWKMDYLLQKINHGDIYKKKCNACLLNSDGGSVIHKVCCTAIKVQTEREKKKINNSTNKKNW